MIRSFLFSLLVIASLGSSAQRKHTFSGYIKDSASGESIIGASITFDQSYSTASNNYGFFSTQLEEGNHTAVVYMYGYERKTYVFDLRSNATYNFLLATTLNEQKTVVVKGKSSDKNIRSNEMSRIEISGDKVKQLPAIFGEADVLRSITLMPGIKSGGEGSSGFYVRGGGPDQNLVMIDEATIYNATHLLGFFSVFNADAVKNVEVIKGGMPANYGGRLSSIVNVSMKDGNNQTYKATGGIGLISSRISIEGPIQKKKSSFIFSARRTYIDKLAQPFLNARIKGSGYYFYDLNFKANYIFSDKDKLYVSSYFGKDVFAYKSPRSSGFRVDVNWGNAIATVRWNHLFSSKLFSNLSCIYNTYGFSTKATFGTNSFNLYSGLADWNIKNDYQYFPNNQHKVKFGGAFIWHTFTPGIATASVNNQSVQEEIKKQYAREGALYINDDWTINKRVNLSIGLRGSMFEQVGPYEKVQYNPDGSRSDSVSTYKRGEKISLYSGLEPRFSGRYILNSTSSIKASVTRIFQYLHLATSAGATLPTDLWIPSSSMVKPQISWQYAAGYFKNFDENAYELSTELYYKPMLRQIEFKPGAQLFFNQNLENEILVGKGLSYGAEVLLRKNRGSLTGWVGYTLSYTTRQFDGLNGNKPYYYRYDRRHDMSLVLTYTINKKWNANLIFVYGTGNWLTLPVKGVTYNYGIQTQQNNSIAPVFNVINQYGNMSNYQMPAYHRADISFTYTSSSSKKFESNWNFSIYNLYNRYNIYFIYNEPDLVAQRINWYKVILFPILPSATWNFKF